MEDWVVLTSVRHSPGVVMRNPSSPLISSQHIIEQGIQKNYLACVWTHGWFRAQIVLDLLCDNLFVDIEVRYPVPVFLHRRHSTNVFWWINIAETYNYEKKKLKLKSVSGIKMLWVSRNHGRLMIYILGVPFNAQFYRDLLSRWLHPLTWDRRNPTNAPCLGAGSQDLALQERNVGTSLSAYGNFICGYVCFVDEMSVAPVRRTGYRTYDWLSFFIALHWFSSCESKLSMTSLIWETAVLDQIRTQCADSWQVKYPSSCN